MDPDTTLAEIRVYVRVVLDDSTSASTRATHGEWLAERVEQLDQWLSRGGFPPSAWNKPPQSLPETLDELHALSHPTPYPAPDATRRRAATAGLEAIERELKANPWERRS